LHQTKFHGTSGYRSAVGYKSWFESLLFQAICSDAIDVHFARQIYEFASPARPAKVKFVLAHRDLCPENLLLRSGKICSIDNMLLSGRAYSEDLARTWCRWKMTPDQWGTFIVGYREFNDPQRCFEESKFWIVFALVSSIVSRKRMDDRTASQQHCEFLRHYMIDPESLFRPYRQAAA
jgi:hypothetical protein